ncbi:MAG: Rrf2 family transcriptional regulator [Pirellulaceae bacterium]|nr:Rrf2 family transcriptional regulator [Pirellulaceae bacterium]
MNVSAKTEYACLAVLELAGSFGSGEPIQIRRIADVHGIPARFLVQILLQLKGAGLVSSTRGAAGGYQLARDPAELTLAEVMAVVEGQPAEMRSSASVPTATSRALLDAWREVATAEREMLSGITFADLVQRVRGQTEQMYYI